MMKAAKAIARMAPHGTYKLLTGFAISQGSQLWFDLMKRLLNVRTSELQPASKEHAAKDKKRGG